VRVFIDESAKAHASILVNGGKRGLQIEIAPDVLVSMLQASVRSLVS
jgi:Cys-tRNA(Pro)/Cys-tRNA(Cys) deacylase